MSITTSDKPEDKKVKIAKLRELHQPIFEAAGIPGAIFLPKMAYRPKDKDEIHISFFPSELQRGQDIFTEFVSRDYDSEDVNRTLYKWKYTSHWQEEYDVTEPSGASGAIRYLIPVAELTVVKAEESAKKLDLKLDDIMDPDQDAPFDQLTIRDLAAILLKQPVSHKKWLNKLIDNTSRR
jgi:hypothetical protein